FRRVAVAGGGDLYRRGEWKIGRGSVDAGGGDGAGEGSATRDGVDAPGDGGVCGTGDSGGEGLRVAQEKRGGGGRHGDTDGRRRWRRWWRDYRGACASGAAGAAYGARSGGEKSENGQRGKGRLRWAVRFGV